MNHTPPKPSTTEEYSDVVAKHITCALRLYDKAEDIDLTTYYNQNHTTIERLSKAWASCKDDSTEAYARCLCYSNLGYSYNPHGFNEICELHYSYSDDHTDMKQYWHNVVRYTQRSLGDLI